MTRKLWVQFFAVRSCADWVLDNARVVTLQMQHWRAQPDGTFILSDVPFKTGWWLALERSWPTAFPSKSFLISPFGLFASGSCV